MHGASRLVPAAAVTAAVPAGAAAVAAALPVGSLAMGRLSRLQVGAVRTCTNTVPCSCPSSPGHHSHHE
eukprot:scaffold53668_cov23-Tisochrysis_lutea.AAC.1